MARRRQEQLELGGTTPTARRGRAERAVDESVRAARAAGALDVHEHAAPVVLARQLARACDVAERAGDVWKLAAAARELRPLLEQLGTMPSRSDDTGALDRFIEQLSSPQVLDTADPG